MNIGHLQSRFYNPAPKSRFGVALAFPNPPVASNDLSLTRSPRLKPIEHLLTHAIELFKQGEYEDVMLQLFNPSMATAANIEYGYIPTFINAIPSDFRKVQTHIDQYLNGQYRYRKKHTRPAVIFKPLIYKAIPRNDYEARVIDYVNNCNAYMAIEEWLHAFQNGRTPLARKTQIFEQEVRALGVTKKELTALYYVPIIKLLRKHNPSFSLAKFSTLLDKAYGSALMQYPAQNALKAALRKPESARKGFFEVESSWNSFLEDSLIRKKGQDPWERRKKFLEELTWNKMMEMDILAFFKEQGLPIPIEMMICYMRYLMIPIEPNDKILAPFNFFRSKKV